MTAADVIAEARARGVKLTPNGDRLRFEGPVTPDLKARLAAHKQAILELLRVQGGQPTSSTPAAPARAQVAPTAKPDPNAGIGDLPPGLLTALRESGASLHVETDGSAAALVVQPWAALHPQLQADAIKYGMVLAAILLRACKRGTLL